MNYKSFKGKRFGWCGKTTGEFCEAWDSPKYNGACCQYYDVLMVEAMKI